MVGCPLVMAVTPQQLASTLIHRNEERLRLLAERANELRRLVGQWATERRARGEVTGVWLTGSLAKGTWGEQSDVDVVVEGLTRPDGATWDELVALLGTSVDLLRIEELPADFARRVRDEGEKLA